eukprot:3074825-Rhodomonas_salina.1
MLRVSPTSCGPKILCVCALLCPYAPKMSCDATGTRCAPVIKMPAEPAIVADLERTSEIRNLNPSVPRLLWAYAVAPQCLVLTSAMLLPGLMDAMAEQLGDTRYTAKSNNRKHNRSTICTRNAFSCV